MNGGYSLLAAAFGLLIVHVANVEARSDSYAFTDGRWWNGSEFVSKSMYVDGGVFKTTQPKRIDRVVNLHGGYVIPPLSDGHNHFLDVERIDAYIACYLSDGFYYVRDMANMPSVMSAIRQKLNLPTSVDLTSSMQGFTGPGGHPMDMVDYFIKERILPGTWVPDYDPEALFVVRTERDIDQRFGLLLPERPGHVKVFLSFSDVYEKSLTEPGTYGMHRGINPKLVSHIVRLAHAEGLKVMAHVNTAVDFRSAISSGVDSIEHLPGIFYEDGLPPEVFQLTEQDVAEAKRQGATVTPTVGARSQKGPKTAKRTRDELIAANLKMLKKAGVPIIFGSDSLSYSPLIEMSSLRSAGLFSNQELIEMVTRITSERIFPNRRIGRLEDGYEASFLALERDPLESLDNLRSIALRVKQGSILELPGSALSRPGFACFN